jgi:hypothetical protein
MRRMDVSDLLSDAKAHARVDHHDDDAGIVLMLSAATADVAAAAEYDLPEDANDLPADLRFAIIDQVALLFDARGGDTDRPVGLSLAASRIVARYRGVRMCPVNP